MRNNFKVYYEIKNEKTGYKKSIDAELFSSDELAKIVCFYKKIGFKVKIYSFKNSFEKELIQ